MGGGRDTSEYRTIFACAIDLRLAIHRHDLTQLEDKLSSRNIISKSELSSSISKGELSSSISKGESAAYESSWKEPPKLARAASLVWLIQNKVEQDAKTFHTFIGLLEEDKERYHTVLLKLQQTYAQFQQGHKAKNVPSRLPGFVSYMGEDVLKSLVCDDDDCRGRRIRRGLGWIITMCAWYFEHRWPHNWPHRWPHHWPHRWPHSMELRYFGKCLGLNVDEVMEIVYAVPDVETQVRLMIYQWSSKDKLRGEGTVRSFMEALFNGRERDLLMCIIHGAPDILKEIEEEKSQELTPQATTKVDVSRESYDPAAATRPHMVGSSTMVTEDVEKLLSTDIGEMETEMLDFKPQESGLEVMEGQQGGMEDLANIQTGYSGSGSMQIAESSTFSSIPFIKPLEILRFDSTGAIFTAFDEIRIKIPPNAIPDGSTGYLQVGVCLYGPFMFEEEYQPISPILWMCLRENTCLEKPISVTLPHILPNVSEKDLASFRVRFVKANHDCVTNAHGERVYKFQPSSNKPSYYIDGGGKGYGAIQIDHFCFLCLEAGSTVSSQMAQSLGYCLHAIGMNDSSDELRFYATYFLETCTEALAEQLGKDPVPILMKKRFTLCQDCDHIAVVCDSREAVNMIPLNGKIRESEINFWGTKSYKEMKLEHEQKIYPPKVKVTAKDLDSTPNIKVSFSNVQQGDDLDIEATLRSRTDVKKTPSTNASFVQQDGDTSDYMETKAVVKCSIPPRWDLKNVHEKFNGSGVTIAVLDSAVNKNHMAFSETTLSGKNFIDGKPDDYWCSNREKHGTMVAGIAMQYAPKAEIFVCCVSDNGNFKAEAIIKALKYLSKDENKCQVIVMSFGRDPEKAMKKRERLINSLVDKGSFCIAAVGNHGLNADYIASPACFPSVIAVGGLDRDGYQPSTLNNPGPIDVYAPGVNVSAPCDDNNYSFRECKGSSCAAPAIGGIVALLLHCAREYGVPINNVKVLKEIFSRMKENVEVNGEIKEVLSPKKFFREHDTADKFKTFVETIQSNGSS